MKNFISGGDVVELIAPSGGVVSGNGYIHVALFAVAQVTAAETEVYSAVVEGIVSLPKTSTVVFSEGEKVFWDDATKLCKETSAGYFKIGYAVKSAGNPSATVLVKLNGSDVTAV